MLALLPLVVTLASLAALIAWRLRQVRLQMGAAGLVDVVVETGVTDRTVLARSKLGQAPEDHVTLFARAHADRLPTHPLTRLLDAEAGHGLCLALGLAGVVLAIQHGEPPSAMILLSALAMLYQTLGALWRLALVLELREQQPDDRSS